jgi:hypothetical protein
MKMTPSKFNLTYKENSPIGEPLGDDRGVVALMRLGKFLYFPISSKKARLLVTCLPVY